MENWRTVHGDPNYQVSDLGNVRSLDRVIMRSNGVAQRLRGRPLKPVYAKRGGYPTVVLSRGKRRYVHHLVLEAFVSPMPKGQEALHINGDPRDARVSNLRWGTHLENEQDKLRHGRHHQVNKKTCPRGHPLQEGNLVASILPYRSCLACSRAKARAQHSGTEFSEREANEQFTKLVPAKAPVLRISTKGN